MSLTLNLYVNNYEKKSPISLLRLPFSSFIPFSKADKWTKGVWRVLSILLSLIDSKPFAYSRGCMKEPKDMHMYLRFGSDWLGWNLITCENKRNSPLWDSESGLPIVVFINSSSWWNYICNYKHRLIGYVNILPLEVKYFIQTILNLSFYWGSHVKKMGTQRSILCIIVSSSSQNVLHHRCIKLVLLV